MAPSRQITTGASYRACSRIASRTANLSAWSIRRPSAKIFPMRLSDLAFTVGLEHHQWILADRGMYLRRRRRTALPVSPRGLSDVGRRSPCRFSCTPLRHAARDAADRPWLSQLAERPLEAEPRGAGAPRSRPAVLKSSSTSGQWIPNPPPAKRQLARCSGVADRRRGYHVNGTEIVRPSRRSTIRSSSVNRTPLTRSPGRLSEVFIPRLQQSCLVLDDVPLNSP
jgi:hypothetical protein